MTLPCLWQVWAQDQVSPTLGPTFLDAEIVSGMGTRPKMGQSVFPPKFIVCH